MFSHFVLVALFTSVSLDTEIFPYFYIQKNHFIRPYNELNVVSLLCLSHTKDAIT